MLTLRMSELNSVNQQMNPINAIENGNESNLQITLLDRSLIGDAAFCYRMHLDGNISDVEMKAYNSIREERGYYRNGDPTTMNNDTIVDQNNVITLLYIDVDPLVCHERVLKRGVSSEKDGVSLTYLDNLDAVYVNLVLKVGFPCTCFFTSFLGNTKLACSVSETMTLT